jgi:hypothetical protein
MAITRISHYCNQYITVRNVGDFPGGQTVGLPTLVQNSPTAKDRQPNLLGQTAYIVWVAGYRKKEKKNYLPRELNSQSKTHWHHNYLLL